MYLCISGNYTRELLSMIGAAEVKVAQSLGSLEQLDRRLMGGGPREIAGNTLLSLVNTLNTSLSLVNTLNTLL